MMVTDNNDTLSAVCPVLPDALLLKQGLRNKGKQEVVGILNTVLGPKDIPNILQLLLSTTLFGMEKDLQALICSEILFDLLSLSVATDPTSPASIAEVTSIPPLSFATAASISLSPETKVKFLLLLKVCPEAARVPDNSGNLLLHYVVMMEFPDRDLIRFLCFAYPASISIFMEPTDHDRMTPFHCLLLKPEVDYEAALYMAMVHPKAARDELASGKFPLHLVVSTTAFEDAQVEFQLNLVKKLLMEYPKAAFVEIVEEIRILRLTGLGHLGRLEESSEEETASSQPPPVLTLPPSMTASSTREQSFSMQVQTLRWSPVMKVEQSSDFRMKSVFRKFVDHMGYRHLQSRIRK